MSRCRNTLAPDGTGLLIAPSHRMMADIPMANVEAMLEGFAIWQCENLPQMDIPAQIHRTMYVLHARVCITRSEIQNIGGRTMESEDQTILVGETNWCRASATFGADPPGRGRPDVSI